MNIEFLLSLMQRHPGAVESFARDGGAALIERMNAGDATAIKDLFIGISFKIPRVVVLINELARRQGKGYRPEPVDVLQFGKDRGEEA